MGLKEIKHIRQYTDFDVDGKVVKMYEMLFTTEKTKGEFTVDIRVDEYTPEKGQEVASKKAEEIDGVIS